MVAQAPSESSLSFLDAGLFLQPQHLDSPTEEQSTGRASEEGAFFSNLLD